MYEGYQVYSRAASGQSLFYKKDYDTWEYAHRIERWIVGPTIGDATVRLRPLDLHTKSRYLSFMNVLFKAKVNQYFDRT